MADNKGGSDLDIFDELAKKKEPSSLGSSPGSFGLPGGAPPPPPPIPSRPPAPGPIVHHKTLLGMPNPFLPGGVVGAPPTPPPPPPTIQVPGQVAPPSVSPPVPGSAVAGQPYPPPPPPIKPAEPAGVDMNWDDDDDEDEEEKTTIFDRAAEVDLEVTRVAPPGAAASAFTPLPPAPAPLAPFSSRPGPKPPMPLSTPPLSPGNPFMLGGPSSRAPLPLQVPSVGLTAPGLGSRQTIPPSSGGMSRPPLRAPSLPAPPPPQSTRSYAPPPPDILVSAPPKAARKSGLWMVFMLVAAAGAAAYFLMPRTGKILIVAAGEAGRPLERVTVLIDGAKKCEVVPCTLELDKGVHIAKASAEGYIPQQVGVEIRAGDETPMNFKLTKSSAGTGLKVAGKQDGVVLFVDGKEVGPLPQELKTLAAGTHALRFKGSDRYTPEERSITIGEDEVKDLGTVSLKVVRGLATFDVRTPGAKVTLVSGDERRQLGDFSQPVEIDVTKNWSVEGSKAGYDSARQPLTFDDRADKTFVISLAEKSVEPKAGTAVATVAPHRRPAVAKPAAAAEDDDSDKPEKPAASGGGTNCTLNLNSIPVSNIVLDGKPLGSTPKMGVSVPAGAHFVTFANDDAKKSTSASCKAGETKTVAVRLNAPAPAE